MFWEGKVGGDRLLFYLSKHFDKVFLMFDGPFARIIITLSKLVGQPYQPRWPKEKRKYVVH